MRSKTLFTVALAVLIVLGCSDSTSPNIGAHVNRIYVLETVDGGQLPVQQGDSTTGFYEYDSGVLELRPDGSALLTTVERSVNHDSVFVYTNAESLQYQIRGDSISVGSRSPCLCVFSRYGVISELNVTLSVGVGAPVFIYQRTQ